MEVRLMKKLAKQLDGIDVSARQEGDLLDLPPRDAQILIDEGWAIYERRVRSEPAHGRGRRADDHPRSRRESLEKQLGTKPK